MASLCDDEVVVNGHAHQLSRLDELPRDPDVFTRGLRVAWSRDRSAIQGLLAAVSPIPLPKPDVPVSEHPAFHLTYTRGILLQVLSAFGQSLDDPYIRPPA